jgi:hypothetical protein
MTLAFSTSSPPICCGLWLIRGIIPVSDQSTDPVRAAVAALLREWDAEHGAGRMILDLAPHIGRLRSLMEAEHGKQS